MQTRLYLHTFVRLPFRAAWPYVFRLVVEPSPATILYLFNVFVVLEAAFVGVQCAANQGNYVLATPPLLF